MLKLNTVGLYHKSLVGNQGSQCCPIALKIKIICKLSSAYKSTRADEPTKPVFASPRSDIEKLQTFSAEKAAPAFKYLPISRSSERSALTNNQGAGAGTATDLAHASELCVICFEILTLPRTLACGHRFCTECIDESFKQFQPKCPSCSRICGVMKGTQPEKGTISVALDKTLHLAGYERYNTIVIDYHVPKGIEGTEHPNPGQPYSGASRRAYLPCSPEGQDVSLLLQRAFEQRLVFTIGHSSTTGMDNSVIWNDIYHKTRVCGPYGYPDETYLTRVKDALAAKGIVPENLPTGQTSKI